MLTSPVAALLDNGAELESLNTRFQTPLHSFFCPFLSNSLAATLPQSKTCRLMSGGMNLAHYFSWTNSSVPVDFQCLPNVRALLDCRDAEGRTPLHLAAHRSNIAVMEYLLSQSPIRDHARPDNKGNTAIHQAVLSVRAPDAIQLLLSHNFRLYVRNQKGHAPIQHAARYGTAAALSFLVERGPSLVSCQDPHGHYSRALAKAFENRKVVAWLISQSGEQARDISIKRPSFQRSESTKKWWDWCGLCLNKRWLGAAVLLGLLLGYLLGVILRNPRCTSEARGIVQPRAMSIMLQGDLSNSMDHHLIRVS